MLNLLGFCGKSFHAPEGMPLAKVLLRIAKKRNAKISEPGLTILDFRFEESGFSLRTSVES